ncbi:MAG: hypothetical protein CVU56_09270 [Deltaproteobacteria bacterium HGW-Deltaproteobacteria-14]|nr:MAG: hypothetical protein CVU56_09270 [Deltaproteobacteria bacterium HGW-Deltaproteobacteria-14]
MTTRTPLSLVIVVAATALAACFPAVDRGADDVDTDSGGVDTLGQETAGAGDTTSQDTNAARDVLGLDCSVYSRTCVRSSFDLEAADYCVETVLVG